MNYKLDEKKSRIEFIATAPFHKFKGWSENGFEGNIDIDFEKNIINDINIVIKTKYFETGDKLKNSEMQKYIKGNDIPNSSFKLIEVKEMIKLEVYPDATSYDIIIIGVLNFMSIEREIELKLKASKTENRLYADVEFNLSFKNYGLKPPKILFIKVKDIVKISTYLEFTI